MENLRAEVSCQAAQTRGVLAEFAADLHHGGAVFARLRPPQTLQKVTV